MPKSMPAQIEREITPLHFYHWDTFLLWLLQICRQIGNNWRCFNWKIRTVIIDTYSLKRVIFSKKRSDEQQKRSCDEKCYTENGCNLFTKFWKQSKSDFMDYPNLSCLIHVLYCFKKSDIRLINSIFTAKKKKKNYLANPD